MDRFVLFGGQHLGALAAIAVATVLAVRFVRRDPRSGRARGLRLALGVLLPGLFAVEYLGAWREGWLTLQVVLPLHLCDVARLLAAVGLLSLDRRLVEPLYFFALAGTVPALLTPDVTEPFPSFRTVLFFVPHGLTVLATCLLVWGFGLVPSARAWWRSWLQLNAYAAVVGALNWTLGTNFLYLAAKPPSPTPFDWFGPWPWYVGTLELLTLGTFLALDLPLRASGRRSAASRSHGRNADAT